MILMAILLQHCGISHAEQTIQPIRFGSVAMDTPRLMHQRLLPLTQYLAQELGRPVELVLAPNMPAAINDVATGNVELAYLTPVAYLRSKQMSNTQLIVKTVTNNEASFKLMIVVRDDSSIQKIEDLAGKRFAFGDPAALLQRAVVVGAGINLDALGRYEFLDHYDNIVRGVLHRDFDAGILKDTMAYKWKDKGIRILYSSEELPPYNITAASHVDNELLERIRKAFLKLNIKQVGHQEIIKALDPNYTGFAATNDEEYDIVRMLTKPFANPDQQ